MFPKTSPVGVAVGVAVVSSSNPLFVSSVAVGSSDVVASAAAVVSVVVVVVRGEFSDLARQRRKSAEILDPRLSLSH